MGFRLFCFTLVLLLAACSSSPKKIDPSKRYVRYFHPTKEVAYTLSPPVGNWIYHEPKYERTGFIVFRGSLSPYAGIEVSFDIDDLVESKSNAPFIDAHKYFFRTKRYKINAYPEVETVFLGGQGHKCIMSKRAVGQHEGPDKDPAISGQWAGKGHTRYVYQTTCPFHIGERYIDLIMQKTYRVFDTAEANSVKVDLHEIDDEIERRLKPVWDSLIVSDKLSQAPMPE